MSFIYDLSDTWNAGSTVFTAIKMNVTNTASASGSKLIDLQIGGSSQFYADKTGTGYFANDLGIGVAASSWGGSFSAIDLGNYGSVWNSSGGTIGFSHNAYHNGTNYIYKQTAAAASYQQASGIHSWHIAASGTAGAVISFTQAMTLNASGNIGIGTSSPSTKLDVASAAGSTTAYTALFRSTNTNGYSGLIGIGVAPATAGAYTAAAFAAENSNGTANDGGRLKFYTAADDASHTLTERMRIDSSGNVGIGTSTPTQKLTVSGGSVNADNFYIQTQGASQAGTVGFANANGPGIQFWGSSTGNAGSLTFNTASTERMRIDSSGNVGIGTSAPQSKVEIRATSGGSVFNALTLSNYVGASVNTGVALHFDPNGAGDLARTASIQSVQSTSGNYADLRFFTANSDTPAERMRINSSGNVGIGTSAPGQKLDVTTSGGDDGIALNNSSTTGGRVRLNSTGAGGRNYHITSTANGSGDGGGKFIIRDSTASDAARFTIDSSGNVGIGTSSPAAKLDVATSAGRMLFTYNSTANFISSVNAANSAYVDLQINGATTQFYTGGAERMRIDSSGNLLVGTTTTSPNPGVAIVPSGAMAIGNNAQASGWGFINFSRSGTAIGSITQNGTTAVAYNTSSDRRLKHDIVDAPEASSLIDAIKVRSFKWNADDSEQRYGFIAQELVEVAPEAVHQPADPEEMMGVDYSKLVPMLIKEIQSLRARVAQLEGK